MKTNLLNHRLGKNTATSSAKMATKPTLTNEHIWLLNKLGMPKELIDCVSTVVGTRLQLGLMGSGTQTPSGFTNLYNYNLMEILNAFSGNSKTVTVHTTTGDEVYITGAMSHDPDFIAEHMDIYNPYNRAAFILNTADAVLTSKVDDFDSCVSRYQVGFMFMHDDSVLVSDPGAIINFISRPMNVELRISYDPVKLIELEKKLQAEEDALTAEQKAKEEAEAKLAAEQAKAEAKAKAEAESKKAEENAETKAGESKENVEIAGEEETTK